MSKNKNLKYSSVSTTELSGDVTFPYLCQALVEHPNRRRKAIKGQ